jgi:ABC-2 type transport system ATP-binding protein
MPINNFMSKTNLKAPVLQVNNLTVRFDKFVAVDDVSFSVHAGQVLGILGGNGAGKSTTLKVLGGILRPTTGEIILDGLDLSNSNDANKAKTVTGYCPDVGGLITGATPREHVKLLLTLHGKSHLYKEGIALVEMFGLKEFMDTPSSGFSHGMSRRLSVALATLASQKILILDEPFDGVDPQGVAAINETIKQAKENGLAIIVSTHLQDLLVDVADNIVVMKKSQIAAVEPSENFKGDRGKIHYENILAGITEDVQEKSTLWSKIKSLTSSKSVKKDN